MALSQVAHAVVEIPSNTGETADNMAMTFACGDTLPFDSADYASFATAIREFVTDLRGLNLLRGSHNVGYKIKVYNPLLPRPNYPLYEEDFDLTGSPSTPSLPREVALCVSYYNTLDTTAPRARRRGRFYIPGFNETDNGDGRPVTAIVDMINTAVASYLDKIGQGWVGNAEPCVYSRVDGVGYIANRWYVDNEWDTQRRRGTRPTSRSYVSGWGG